MSDAAELDIQLEELTRWIRSAAKALISCYLPGKGYFLRDTLPHNDSDVHSVTSTNRAFFALVDYLRFLQEEGLGSDDERAAFEVIKEVSQKYLGSISGESREARSSTDNGINMFTDGHLFLSIAVTVSLSQTEIEVGLSKKDTNGLRKTALHIADTYREDLVKWRGGKLRADDEVHDFVTLHLVRGIDALDKDWFENPLKKSLGDRVRSDVLRQLGFGFAGVTSRFDPAELVFSVALLNRFAVQDAPQLTERAVRSIVDSQGLDGAWPTARMVSYGTRGLLHVTSFEVALTLANLLVRDIRVGANSLDILILESLRKAFGLVKMTFTETDGRQGWANDHARWSGHVESWATAIILSFLLRYRDVLLELRQQRILSRYRLIVDFFVRDSFVWPDLDPVLRGRTNADWSVLDRISDPTDNGLLVESLRAKLIEPIVENWAWRPKVASLALSGPPGSRKTSLVRSLAKCLHWPFLVLSPPQFLSAGLEGFESTAERIFQDLLRLRRVVVLFDECEDFFRLRPAEQRTETRTLGAFITSGMLPRLQSLRDKRWVLFFLATNSPLSELDEAVTRQGRFDFSYKLDYPTAMAQRRYVEKRMKPSTKRKAVQRAIEQFAQAHSKDKRKPAISFSLLDKLVDEATSGTDVMFKRLAEIAGQEGPEDLMSRRY